MSMPHHTRQEIARRALPLVDLTNLSETCDAGDIDALVTRGLTAYGPVAALCVWPEFVQQAATRLQGKGVKVATVVNFPHGSELTAAAVADTRTALSDGADEIDLVLPYPAFLDGREEVGVAMIEAVREVMPLDRCLKVILETGALGNAARIAHASNLALAAGADMLKTSTGKVPIGATPEAATAMLHSIRQSGTRAGFKASGGVGTIEDAGQYLQIADSIMGEGWAQVGTFRFGASSLLSALLAVLEAPAHA